MNRKVTTLTKTCPFFTQLQNVDGMVGYEMFYTYVSNSPYLLYKNTYTIGLKNDAVWPILKQNTELINFYLIRCYSSHILTFSSLCKLHLKNYGQQNFLIHLKRLRHALLIWSFTAPFFRHKLFFKPKVSHEDFKLKLFLCLRFFFKRVIKILYHFLLSYHVIKLLPHVHAD